MADFSVSTFQYQTENRSWLLSPHGTDPGMTPNIKLDVSAFTAATHYPNGYILGGTVLGKITATGLYAPFAAGAADGTQTAAGILFSSERVPNTADTTVDTNGVLFWHGRVDAAKLPIANAATGGGFITSAARTSLNNIRFEN